MSEFKNKTIKGLIWSTIEQFASQGIAFILGIIIARQVMPSEYGLIAMLGIFMAIAQTFVDSGFSNALIQKHDRSKIDYATVFYFNIAVSVLFFLALFFSAPLIAEFYNEPRLDLVTKIVGVNILLSALIVVPRAKLSVEIDFKSQTKASMTAVTISGVVGIIMAYNDYGVWALVAQGLLNNAVNASILWFYSKWFPRLEFSIESFKKLFTFGSKLLFSGLLDTVFRNLYQLVIGKKFSSTDLGYYSRANQLAEFPSSNFSRVISRVAFPIMCEVQYDNQRLKDVFKKFLKLSVFIIFPLMVGFAALAEPFISLFLTDKWLPAVPLLQALAIACMFYPVHGINLNVLQAKGRTDLFLKLEIIKKVLSIAILIATVPFGVLVMCFGLIVGAILCLPINMYYTKQMLNIGYLEQVKYLLPSLLLSFAMGGLLYCLNFATLANWMTLLIGIPFSILFYYFVAKMMRMEEIDEIHELLGRFIPYFRNK